MEQKKIHSVWKALEVLRSLADGAKQLTELSEELGVKKSALCHLINTLESENVVKRAGRKIELGDFLFEICRKQENLLLNSAVPKIMWELYRALPKVQFVCFGTPRRTELNWSVAISKDQLWKPNVTLSPFVSAAGLMDAAVRGNVFSEAVECHLPFTEFGSRFWGTREKYRAFLAESLAKGYTECPFDTDAQYKVSEAVKDSRGVYRGILGFGIQSDAVPAERKKAREILTECNQKLKTQI